ncbi:MAG: prephenate dehydratase [Promethearchaeota archaeon]
MSENEKNEKELKRKREEISYIDDEIINLLNKRAIISSDIGEIKKKLNLEVYQPHREAEVIEYVKNKSLKLKPSHLEAIWKEIIGACKDIQGSIVKIGYLGPKGTFTHQAALDFFPKAGSEFIAFKNILEIFEGIEKDILEFGVVPIENSLQGTVRETLDLLIEKNLVIYGEVELRIIQNLIAMEKSNLTKINNLYSHPQGFAQSRTWIKANLPKAKLINTSSTAEAVRMVKELNDEANAAIGAEIACNIYNLKILNSKIEDNSLNFTRFLIISKEENKIQSGKIRSSIVYVTKHVPGALFNVLRLFAEGDVNLLKIESRPRRKGRWEYIFLMDFEGDARNDPKIHKIFEEMNKSVIWFKILGAYPMN